MFYVPDLPHIFHIESDEGPLGVGGQKSEARGRRPGVGGQGTEARGRRLEARGWRPEEGGQGLEAWGQRLGVRGHLRSLV